MTNNSSAKQYLAEWSFTAASNTAHAIRLTIRFIIHSIFHFMMVTTSIKGIVQSFFHMLNTKEDILKNAVDGPHWIS